MIWDGREKASGTLLCTLAKALLMGMGHHRLLRTCYVRGSMTVHHLCPLLPQPELSWRGFVMFSDRSMSISRVGKCPSPETALSFTCCTCQAPFFAGRETLAAMRREVIKNLQYGQTKLARQSRKVRFPGLVFCDVITPSSDSREF